VSAAWGENIVIPPVNHGKNSKSTLLRFFVLTVLRLRGHNFENHRLAFRDELSLIAWQFGEQRQFHPLQNRFNPPQMMAANGNLVRREDELEVLLVAATVEFRKDEMIVWQQQRTIWRCFNA
jgi:hypothetical protein